MMPHRPNIVLINPDQWRAHVMGHLGNSAAHTPNLDQMVATEAVSFRNAFCQNPVCTPSRCSFMTGWYPHVRGHRTMFHMLQPDEPVLLKRLKNSGYFVWWGGKNDLVPAQYGYEPFCNIKYNPSPPPAPYFHSDRMDQWRGSPQEDRYYSFYAGKLDASEDMDIYYDPDWAWILGAIDFIYQAPHDQPFCIYLPILYPHPPYGVEEPWYSLIDRHSLPPPLPVPDWTKKPSILKGIFENQRLQNLDETFWNELRAVYYGMCARVDHQIGLLIEALKKTGNYDNTAIFVFSDHGDFTGDYGLVEKNQNTFEDCLTRVPFIIKPPASIPCQPGVRDALVELIDLTATVEDLAGLRKEYDHFGHSLLPILEGKTDHHRDAVFCEGGRRHEEWQCNESDSLPDLNKENLYYPRLVLQRSDGPEHTRAVMVRTHRYKYVMRLYELDELYDLKQDPGELYNRIDDPQMADILAMLKDRLLRFFLETSDVVSYTIDRRQ